MRTMQESYLSARELQDSRGLTAAQLAKVRAAARAGKVRRLPGEHCRTDYRYASADVLATLGLAHFPKY